MIIDKKKDYKIKNSQKFFSTKFIIKILIIFFIILFFYILGIWTERYELDRKISYIYNDSISKISSNFYSTFFP